MVISFLKEKDVLFSHLKQANKMLRKCYDAYLAHIIEASADTSELLKIFIMGKFIEVFLDELLSLPSYKE